MSFTFVDLFAATVMAHMAAKSSDAQRERERLKDRMKPDWEPDLG